MAMGPEKGLEKANELGLKAYFLVKDKDKFKELSTTNFGKSL
jgi:thiamine biosynthesis lipoprotein ApbE